ncbi:hypothetical protein ACPYPG_36300 [Streptomyces sp. FR-108]|uniref:hypothetical protein n=1 Tax=Streptomyces sp. FR-108 TaxID=3416665 RepID=UPI003CF169F3
MTVYAIEIILTRTIDAAELKAAQQERDLPMAAAGDQKRLVVLVAAKNERRAVRKIWKRLEDALPIDVLCTLFPGPDGKYLMSIPMSEEVQEQIQRLAAADQKTPEEYLQQAIERAPARDRSTRRAQLECSLSRLFRTYSPEEVTGAAARRIGGM